jgi:26S proteasome non-ATPase regulatory subunit 9
MESELLKINDQREAMEKEMGGIVELLDNMQGTPGLKSPLVDYEGFPRADVDIFEVRKLRNRHACLQTDHGRLMKELEQKLYAMHAGYIEKGLVDVIPPKSEPKDVK